MNTNYWLLAPTVAASLIAVAFALLWRHEQEMRVNATTTYKTTLDGMFDVTEQLEEQALQLQAEKADLHDALLDAQNEIKALHRQTVEIPAASAKVPARPKRTAAKKNEKVVASE